jgi:hypothetical protein
MWHCGDEVCDCTQPQIIGVSTEHWRDPDWKQPKGVEDGPYRSEPTLEERAEQVKWLLEKAAEYQVSNLEDIQREYGK